jgi:hypothetical protein
MVQPTPIYQAWCSGSGGTKGLIASIPAGASSPNASLNDGFPLITMTYAGGQPPKGADMNGILNWITQYCVWVNGGGQFPFNATFASAPGYAIGAVVQLTGGLSSYVNLAANNTNDPNSVLTNWAPWAGAVKANVADLNGTTAALGAALVAYNSAVGATYAAGTVGAGLYTAIANAAAAATSASNAQAAANTANAAIANLTSTAAIYGAGMVGFSSASAYAANTVGAALRAMPASLFAVQNNVTASRTNGTSYTCPGGAGKPMFIHVYGDANGNATLSLFVNGSNVNSASVNSPNSLSITGLVPPGGTYAVAWSGAVSHIYNWFETY